MVSSSRPSSFTKEQLEGGNQDSLNPKENVSPNLVGITVDYLTRFMTGSEPKEAFTFSAKGAKLMGEMEMFSELLNNITGLDDNSIVSAIKLSGFDVVYRGGFMEYVPIEEINPDADTIQNVREMVNRSLAFFELYGGKVLDELTFEGGYTIYVWKGDGDFMTQDTLWDFKVLRGNIQSKHTLQLMMYWRMGLHSIHPEYKNVKYLGVFNPRKNLVYRLPVETISDEVIKEVDTKIIGY